MSRNTITSQDWERNRQTEGMYYLDSELKLIHLPTYTDVN